MIIQSRARLELSEIVPGQAFMFAGDVFMLIRSPGMNLEPWLAVNLRDGVVSRLRKDTAVEPIKAKIVIE